ncbi:MAG: cyclic nucleotide-binding domain-containing protein [Planctomycetota bacterium]
MATEGWTDGDVLGLEEMLALPVFLGCQPELLDEHVGAVLHRNYAPGEVLCREGALDATAFLIVEGEAEIFLASPVAHLEGHHRPRGLFRAITSFLQTPARRPAAAAGAARRIPIDAPVDLSQDSPTATLRAGDLFGEMTCLSGHPRSATVRAQTAVVALEMRRGIVDLLKRTSREFQARIERDYKARALASHLRGVPLFSGLSDAFIDGLRERVELVRYEPGQVICTQGDDPAKLYVIRIGFVKVNRASADGEVILRYLHRGDGFGELGLLGAGRCLATCTAVDHVELAEVRREDFDQLVDEFPAIRAELEGIASEQRERKTPRADSTLDAFLTQNLMEAHDLLLLDLDRCTRCDECVRACAASHDGVTRLIRDGLRYDRFLVPTSCRACHDPLCMIGCPVGALRRSDSFEVVIEDWCIGCGLCVKSCPYGNLNLHATEAEGNGQAAETACKAIRCDLCAELAEPACVYACPHEAARRVDLQALVTGER